MKIIKRVGERLLPHPIRAELRPILVFHGAGASLCDGSALLIRRGWALLGQRLHGWERLGVLAGAGYAIGYTCWHAPHIAEFAAPAAVVGWCVAAWWAAPPNDDEPNEDETEDPPAASPEEIYVATLDWIRQQIGDRQAVHLRDLLAHAQAHGILEGIDVTTLRGRLEDHGVPVRDRVRVRGLGVTVGIHRDDLLAPSEPSPEDESKETPETGTTGF